MKIDEVIQAVHCAAREANRAHRGVDPVLVIYMDYDYYYECGSELRDEVSGLAHEFYQAGTIAGFAVHRVVAGPYAGKPAHPPFRVVSVTPKRT